MMIDSTEPRYLLLMSRHSAYALVGFVNPTSFHQDMQTRDTLCGVCSPGCVGPLFFSQFSHKLTWVFSSVSHSVQTVGNWGHWLRPSHCLNTMIWPLPCSCKSMLVHILLWSGELQGWPFILGHTESGMGYRNWGYDPLSSNSSKGN